jgi:hypothetical protein
MRNDLNLHVRAFGQRDDLNGRARGKIVRKISSVNFIHGGEVCEVGQEHRAFHDVGEREFLVIQNQLHIFQHALGLGFDVAGNQAAVGGADGNLSGAVQLIADAHGVIIRTNGGRRFCGFDDDFGGHKMICFSSEMHGKSVAFDRQRQGVENCGSSLIWFIF